MDTKYEFSATQIERRVREAEHEADDVWVSERYYRRIQRARKPKQQCAGADATQDGGLEATVRE
jgi:hypothetical protein